MWSIGSSPPSTMVKKNSGNALAKIGTMPLIGRTQPRIPGTSTPARLTNSWNIWVWWVSSVASWVT